VCWLKDSLWRVIFMVFSLEINPFSQENEKPSISFTCLSTHFHTEDFGLSYQGFSPLTPPSTISKCYFHTHNGHSERNDALQIISSTPCLRHEWSSSNFCLRKIRALLGTAMCTPTVLNKVNRTRLLYLHSLSIGSLWDSHKSYSLYFRTTFQTLFEYIKFS
jgi:hypothetical protein